jgi:galactose-1-phosphate uridylyltransferase
MSDLPHLVNQSSSQSASAPEKDYSPRCPFCKIAHTYQPFPPTTSLETAESHFEPEKLDPPSFVLYSSEYVVAFLDIMPLTMGHVLVAPRKHRVKVGDLSPEEGAEVSKLVFFLLVSCSIAMFILSCYSNIEIRVKQERSF